MLINIPWRFVDKYPISWRGRTKIADVMDLLVDKGFPTEQLQFPDDFNCITQLIHKGAKLCHFAVAYELAVNAMNQQYDFDVCRFLRIVESLISGFGDYWP